MALFRSPHKGFVQNVRSSSVIYHPNTGVELSRTPALRAEFGVFGAEQPYMNPETGEWTTVADIRGGFFDSEAAQVQNGWSDDERDTVEAVLRRYCSERPDLVQEIVAEHVPAPMPWETYPDNAPVDIVTFAPKLSLVPEVVRYERENLARPEVLEPLEKELEKLPPEEQRRAKPIFEVAPEFRGAAASSPLVLGRAPETTATGIVKSTPGLQLKSEASITL